MNLLAFLLAFELTYPTLPDSDLNQDDLHQLAVSSCISSRRMRRWIYYRATVNSSCSERYCRRLSLRHVIVAAQRYSAARTGTSTTSAICIDLLLLMSGSLSSSKAMSSEASLDIVLTLALAARRWSRRDRYRVSMANDTGKVDTSVRGRRRGRGV